MAKWALVVETKCTDPAREAEFSEWYDKIHIPDVLESPGFVKGTRYEFLMPWKIQGGGETKYHGTGATQGKAKFLAVYEIEAEDPSEVMKALDRHIDEKGAQGRLSELVELVSMAIYKRVSSLPK